jgi:ABC-type sugar transport system permease subunit
MKKAITTLNWIISIMVIISLIESFTEYYDYKSQYNVFVKMYNDNSYLSMFKDCKDIFHNQILALDFIKQSYLQQFYWNIVIVLLYLFLLFLKNKCTLKEG